jgi:hypothetical protein
MDDASTAGEVEERSEAPDSSYSGLSASSFMSLHI